MKKLIVLLAAAAMVAGLSGCVGPSQCEKAAKPACCGDACTCSSACEASCGCAAKADKPACDKPAKVKEPKKAAVKETKKAAKKKAAAETP